MAISKKWIIYSRKNRKNTKKNFKAPVKLIGAGRTDKGVHAFGQYANFKVKNKIINKRKFLDSSNFFLKNSNISIIDLKKKRLDFHSRFNAKERIYEYLIINRTGSLSLNKNRAWHIKKKLDISLLKKGTKMLEGKHDFSTFRASSCSSRSPIKKINSIKVKKIKDNILITFKSKSFLQNQVRSMVGCLKNLSCKDWSLDHYKKAFLSKKRKNCAAPAPACGLYLYDVKY